MKFITASLLFVVLVFIISFSAAANSNDLTKEKIAFLLHTASRSQVVSNNPGAGAAAIRAQALVNLAMFEAVNTIEQKYEPFLVQTSDIPSTINLDRAHKVAAAAHAVRGVLDWLYPGNGVNGLKFWHREVANFLTATISDHDDNGYTGGPNDNRANERIIHGIALGKYVAQRLTANRTNDGFTDPAASRVVPNGNNECSYAYNRTWFSGQPFSSAYGFDVRAFGTPDPLYYQNNNLYYVPPPPTCDSAENNADLAEVFGYGTSFVANQTWTAETNLTALYHAGYYGSFNDWSYDVLTTSDIDAEDVDLLRVLAIASMASHDAHAVHWVWKYTYLRARPITAFRLMDVNRVGSTVSRFLDVNWFPPTVTAQTPEYPSGHSSRTSSFVEVFRRAFGDAHRFTAQGFTLAADARFNAEEVAVRTYTSFEFFSNQVNDARVYAGVHYRTSVNAATVLGKRIANHYYDNLLKPN